MQFLLLIAVGLVLMLVVGYFGHLQEKKRREELLALAQRMGWEFRPLKDPTFDDRWRRFACFTRGHSRYAHNRLLGTLATISDAGETVDRPVEAGDYHYRVTTHNGKRSSTSTYRFSYLVVETPTPGGDLAVRTEHRGDKVKAAMGFDDIDFESAEFSDRFHVTAADKRYAYDVLHPRMMEHLLESATPDFEVRGGVLCLTGGRSRWSPGEYELRLRWVAGFFERWPRHLPSARGQQQRSERAADERR